MDAPGLLANDSDPENDSLTVSVLSLPASGSLVLNPNGSFVYVHNGNEATQDSFMYELNDGNGGTDSVNVGISINSVNDPPVTQDDDYSVGEGQQITVAAPGVLSNDTDADEDQLIATLKTAPSNGTVSLNLNGSFTYTHNGSETASDSFVYEARDGNGGITEGNVTITILPQNDPPQANDESYSVDEGAALNIVSPGVLSNDSDPENDVLSVVLTEAPQHGSLTLNGNGSFSYSHDGSETAGDSFTYEVRDGNGGVAEARATITVKAVNDDPVVDSESYAVAEGGTINIAAPGVLQNDTDAENDPLTVVLVDDVKNGQLNLESNGSFSYSHDGSETAEDSFTYEVRDGNGGTAQASATIMVSPINDFPLALDDVYEVSEVGILNVAAPGILLNDSDAEDDNLTASIVTEPEHGTVELASDGSFEYIHDGGESVTDSFKYKVDDGNGGTNEATVRINIGATNDPPIGRDESYNVVESESLNIAAPGVLQNDSDPDGDAMTVVLIRDAIHGELTLQANGSFSYSHDGSETTDDDFLYQIDDGNGGKTTATARISITPKNDQPIARDDSYSIDNGAELVIAAPGLLANDEDAEGDTLSVAIESQPQHGQLELDANGSFTYRHDGGPSTDDSFTYRASDGNGGSAVAAVRIAIGPPPAVPGDFDNDRDVDADDITLMCHALHSQDPESMFDLNGDSAVTNQDFTFLIEEILQTTAGDANLDRIFNSTDLIVVFQAGEYEDAIDGNSTWTEGDWNCDGDFNTSDLVVAFQSGAYSAAAVPAFPNVAAAVLVGETQEIQVTAKTDIEDTGTERKLRRKSVKSAIVYDLIYQDWNE